MHNEKRKRHHYDRRVRQIQSAGRYRQYMDDGSGDRRTVRHDCRAVHAAIKALLEENVLHDYEVCRYVRLENGNGADVYNTEVIIALAFRLNTYPASVFRKWLVKKATAPRRTTPPIVIRYKDGLLN